jgi:hypothetical protein
MGSRGTAALVLNLGVGWSSMVDIHGLAACTLGKKKFKKTARKLLDP